MSNIDNDAVTTEIIEGEVVGETAEKKSFKEKVLAPIKKHPKIATAVGLGVALVAGAAIFGNDTSSTEIPDDVTPDEPTEETVFEPIETVVIDES